MSLARPSDSWEGPSTGFPVVALPQRRQEPVKDDWDDDDDDDDDDEDPQKVWEDANKKPPMPKVVIAPTSAVAAALPVQALQPSMRILKRPSAPATSSTTPNAEAHQKSLAEREAQYQEARDRIFGVAPAGGSVTLPRAPSGGQRGPFSPPLLSASPQLLAPPKPLRSPRGPDPIIASVDNEATSKGGGVARGFRRRGANPRPRGASTRGRPSS